MKQNFNPLKRRQTRNNLLDEYMTKPQTTHPFVRRERLEENHLRLVRILYGPADALIHCETRILPVSSANNRYIAVSYAWGPPVAEHPIFLDGRKHMLAKNLWHFLQIWRSSHASPERARTWLWVDALCIDQTDIGERMHQVKAMSRIFAGARRVLVWLGRATTGAAVDRTFSILEGAYSAEERRFWGRDNVRRDVCGRLYWSRLWVFQELKSARKIELMCGSARVEWRKFKKDLLKYDIDDEDYENGDPVDSFDQVDPVRHSAAASMVRLCSEQMPMSLWTLLQVTSHLRCYDPRDNVYALLSIAKTGTTGINADYAMPLPQLMNLVLTDLHSSNPPRTVHDIAIRCNHLKLLMGLGPDFPWCADDYLAATDPDFVDADPDLMAIVQGSFWS